METSSRVLIKDLVRNREMSPPPQVILIDCLQFAVTRTGEEVAEEWGQAISVLGFLSV